MSAIRSSADTLSSSSAGGALTVASESRGTLTPADGTAGAGIVMLTVSVRAEAAGGALTEASGAAGHAPQVFGHFFPHFFDNFVVLPVFPHLLSDVHLAAHFFHSSLHTFGHGDTPHVAGQAPHFFDANFLHFFSFLHFLAHDDGWSAVSSSHVGSGGGGSTPSSTTGGGSGHFSQTGQRSVAEIQPGLRSASCVITRMPLADIPERSGWASSWLRTYWSSSDGAGDGSGIDPKRRRRGSTERHDGHGGHSIGSHHIASHTAASGERSGVQLAVSKPEAADGMRVSSPSPSYSKSIVPHPGTVSEVIRPPAPSRVSRTQVGSM